MGAFEDRIQVALKVFSDILNPLVPGVHWKVVDT